MTKLSHHPADHFHEVLAMYPEDEVAISLPDLLNRVIRYYQEGDKWHGRHFHATSREEYAEVIAWLKELREMTELMAIEEESCLLIQTETLKINLNPWVKYTRKYSLVEIMYQIRVVKGRMTLYLNSDNIVEYRDCLEAMDRLEYAVLEMILHTLPD